MEFSTGDLHLWRLVVAVVWSIFFQFILLCAYITVMNIEIYNLNLLSASFGSLFTVKNLYIFPLAALIFFQGVVFSREYLKRPKAQFINKRFLIVFNLFSYQNLIAFCMYLTLGFSVFYVYASLSSTSVNTFSTECSEFTNDMCLNEKKLFLVTAGIWVGVYSFIKEYVFSSKTLVFPPIQQHKFIRMKAVLYPCLKRCTIGSLSPSLLFCILYYFKGNLPRLYIGSLSGLLISPDLLDTFLALLDKELIIYLWLFTTVYLLTLEVMTISFNIHLTERAYFSITNFMLNPTNSNTLLLQNALAAEEVPIIQHLAVLDLSLLSQFDDQRRAELFTLSQPGGHPHSWNAIVTECYKLIDKFTDDLDKCIDVFQVDNKSEQQVPKTLDLSAQSCKQHYGMRNLSIKPNIECTLYNDQSPTAALQKSYERLIKVYQEWLNKRFNAFCKRPIIVYFFGEMSEPKIKYLLSQSQPVIWAVESLSLLICHSIKEDDFGVAQKDLLRIIVSLLRLKNGLDKLQKQSFFIKKSNKLDLVDMQMKSALKFSVKQSLYRIAITFKDYIHDINLSPSEYVAQMMSFVQFKEV